MTTLYYKRRFGKFEPIRRTGDGKVLKIVLDEPINARISIGKRGGVLKNGEATLDLSGLEDGIYEPVILKRQGSEILSGFILNEDGALLKSQSFEEIEDIKERLWNMEQNILSLQKKQKELSDKILGTSIF